MSRVSPPSAKERRSPLPPAPMSFGLPGVSSTYGVAPPGSQFLPETDPELDDILGPESDAAPLSNQSLPEHPGQLHAPRTLLGPTDYTFLKMLRRAMPDCEVLARLPISALVEPSRSAAPELSNRLKSLYRRRLVDFVVWYPDMRQVVCVLDLDYGSAEDDPSQYADLVAILGEAGYAYVRPRVLDAPTPTELRELMLNAIDQQKPPEDYIQARILRAGQANEKRQKKPMAYWLRLAAVPALVALLVLAAAAWSMQRMVPIDLPAPQHDEAERLS